MPNSITHYTFRERERERERERLASVARSLLCHVMLMIIIVYIVSSECYFGSMIGKLEKSECLAIYDW